MAKHASHDWLKKHFVEHFPQVNKVEVHSHQSGPHEFSAQVRVKVGKKWLVVKKKGEFLGKALSKAKEVMAQKVRKVAQKSKAHKVQPLFGY